MVITQGVFKPLVYMPHWADCGLLDPEGSWGLGCLKASPGDPTGQAALAMNRLSSVSGESLCVSLSFLEAAKSNNKDCSWLTRHLVLRREGRHQPSLIMQRVQLWAGSDPPMRKSRKNFRAGIFSALIHHVVWGCFACRRTVCFNLSESHIELLISDGKLLSCFGSLSSSKCLLRASFIPFTLKQLG